MANVIRRTIGRGGSVLVPAFAVDRTPVVLKESAASNHTASIAMPHAARCERVANALKS